jgi:AcrR family transcriptional regulator
MSQQTAKAWQKVQTAALELLESGSNEAMSYRSIAARAGVALSTVQYYFPSRDELLESLLDGYYERMRALFDEIVAEGLQLSPPDPQNIARFVGAAVDRFYTFACDERRSLRLRNQINAELGRFPARRDAAFRRPIVDDAERILLAFFPGALDLRFSVQSVVFVVAHYALLSTDEARALFGIADAKELDRRIRDHLQGLAWRLLGLATPA